MRRMIPIVLIGISVIGLLGNVLFSIAIFTQKSDMAFGTQFLMFLIRLLPYALLMWFSVWLFRKTKRNLVNSSSEKVQPRKLWAKFVIWTMVTNGILKGISNPQGIKLAFSSGNELIAAVFGLVCFGLIFGSIIFCFWKLFSKKRG